MKHLAQLTIGIGETGQGHKFTPKQRNEGLKALRKTLGSSFGGYTEIVTKGGWVNPKGRLVQEATLTFQTATDKSKKEIVAVAKLARDTMKQHSVFLIINGKAMFV